MIRKYAKEFLAVYDFIKDKEYTVTNKHYAAAPKEKVEALLEQNLYDETQEKLKKWKGLGWISCDERRLTRRIVYGEKKIRMICMNTAIYVQLKAIESIQKA